MKITVLMENDSCREGIYAEHGLSLFIETEKHRLIMDTGSSDLTWKNADTMGIDLSVVDTVVISHGHYDHTGGLMDLLKRNGRAVIYIRRNAFGAFYHGMKYIGMDQNSSSFENIHYVDQFFAVDDELFLFSDIKGRRLWPQSNHELSEVVNQIHIQDEFSHEQVLVIHEKDQYVLISGCAHNGILNILDKFRTIFARDPDLVISGFHMKKKTVYSPEEISTIKAIACELKRMDHTMFYTGHCTGRPAFDLMKEIMGERLQKMNAGDVILWKEHDIA